MEISTLAALLIKRLDGGLTSAEETSLQDWIAESPARRQAVAFFLDEAQVSEGLAKHHNRMERVWEKLERVMDEDSVKVMPQRRWLKWVAAASIIIAMGVTAYLIQQDEREKPPATLQTTDVKAPETNRAMITLDNGQIIYLDSLANGSISSQGNVTITKTADGKIIYSGNTNEVVYNTLHNPRGSKVIDMTLSDGSHVWLNAGSSVRYPVAFVGNNRTASITGEAYFEITHDGTKPFIVSKGETSITVLGTRFNVNAYDNESDMKVSLLEGSVQINNRVILKPGQQAQVSTEIKVLSNIDMAEVMAWKNGFFQFNGMGIPGVMRQLERWYDINVRYEGRIPERAFAGQIDRNANLSEVLKILRESNVHFRQEGKDLIVTP